jgi:hypothetical protein
MPLGICLHFSRTGFTPTSFMDQQPASLTVATPERSRFGSSVNFGLAVLTFTQAPSAAIKAQLLAEDHNLFDPANPPAAPAAPEPVNLGANGEEADPVKEYLASIKKLDKEALKAQCKSLGLPEAEWEKLGKASLVDYLAKKAAEGEADEAADDEAEDGDKDGDNATAETGDDEPQA